MDIDERIKAYWEDPVTRSLIDENLRMLEEGVVTTHLRPGMEIVDIGCGDGESTIRYASLVKKCLGLERSEHLISRAQEKLSASRLPNLSFSSGDINELGAYIGQFDLAITQRVVTNMSSWDAQVAVMDNVRAVLRPGGIYVMVENISEGHDYLNALRAGVGLREIPRHWHNLYLNHQMVMKYFEGRFHLIRHHTFELYSLLTRVYTNLFASFEGFGKEAVKDPIFQVADQAARDLQEAFGETVIIGNDASLGTIQGYALQKVE